MSDKRMNFRLTLPPFTITGTVGGETKLYTSVPSGQTITGREDMFCLCDTLGKLTNVVSQLNNYEGTWGYADFNKCFEPAQEEDV